MRRVKYCHKVDRGKNYGARGLWKLYTPEIELYLLVLGPQANETESGEAGDRPEDMDSGNL